MGTWRMCASYVHRNTNNVFAVLGLMDGYMEDMCSTSTQTRTNIFAMFCFMCGYMEDVCVIYHIYIGLARTIYILYTVNIRYFLQGNHQIYGHIRCVYTVLANPIYTHEQEQTSLPWLVSWKSTWRMCASHYYLCVVALIDAAMVVLWRLTCMAHAIESLTNALHGSNRA